MTDEQNGPPEKQPEPESTGLAGFDRLPEAIIEREAGAMALVAREEAELKAAILMARHFPRDETQAYTKLMRSAKRPSFADKAVYSFPRGGDRVSGPGIKIARELARCWGNIRHGLTVVSIDKEWVHIKGWAMDMETGNKVELEDKFKRLIYRTRGGWVEPDERDLRELINRRGAICVRNCILQIMPPDIVDDVARETLKTIRKAARGELDLDRETATRHVISAFDAFGVTLEMMEGYLKHTMETLTDEELADLRAVYTSISEGNSRADEYFDMKHQPITSEGTEELDAALAPEEAPPPDDKGGDLFGIKGKDEKPATDEEKEVLLDAFRELASELGTNDKRWCRKALLSWLRLNGAAWTSLTEPGLKNALKVIKDNPGDVKGYIEKELGEGA